MRLLKTMASKLKQTKGFSLVEMLCSTAILALIALMMAAGLPAATAISRDASFASESEILSATINTAIGDVLRYSQAHVAEDGVVHFSNNSYVLKDAYFVVDDYIVMQQDAANGNEGKTINLLNKGAYTTLVVDDFILTYDETSRIFLGSYAIELGTDAMVNKQVEFAFRSMINEAP